MVVKMVVTPDAPKARVSDEPEQPSDVDRARELLGTAKLQNISDRMLAAAQVHATLAVETAVRELIDKLEGQGDR